MRHARRSLLWFIGLLVGALLPFAPVSFLTPAAQADPVFDGQDFSSLCSFSGLNPDCPAFPPPPPLLNPGAVAAAGGEVGASLERLQDQAVDNTLADHGLPESDRAAVLSWGRDDAHAELWALIVQAINTPAAERTTDQQNAAAWMMQLASAQANDAAKQTGAEYTTWAGLDVTEYERMADTASKDQLTAFLSEDVRPFSPLFTPQRRLLPLPAARALLRGLRRVPGPDLRRAVLVPDLCDPDADVRRFREVGSGRRLERHALRRQPPGPEGTDRRSLDVRHGGRGRRGRRWARP